MIQDKAEIVSNKVVGAGYYRMALKSHLIVKDAKPGQFVHIRVSEGNDPLLRRPFSMHSLDDNETFSILYETKGRGSGLLARKKAREVLDIIGPIGHGFNLSARFKRIVLVGGGIGVAPLLMAAQEALRHKARVTLLLGARKKDHLLCVADFKSMGCDVKMITDDGSSEKKGYVTDLLEPVLTGAGKGPAVVLACGPYQMMRRAAIIAGIYDIPCQVSLEESMACGIGACRGCAVMTKNGYKRVCADGPVFAATEIEWID